MKKAFAIVVLLCILLMAGCTKDKPAIIVTSNMLSYEDTGNSFLSARGRYEAVLSVIKTEVSTLENAHNQQIVYDNPDNYFLNDEYILSSFDPFDIEGFNLTEHFDEKTDQSIAERYYENASNGREIQYSFDSGTYTLKFITGGMNDVYTVSCSDKYDFFTFRHTLVSAEGEETADFLDYARLSENTYALQSSKNRCFIQFDNEGHIENFRISEIKEGSNSFSDSIFKTNSVIGKNWVTNNKEVSYSSIIEFEDRVLTHQDSSTGTLKEITIKEEDYASQFYI